jgi:hypothetical protein
LRPLHQGRVLKPMIGKQSRAGVFPLISFAFFGCKQFEEVSTVRVSRGFAGPGVVLFAEGGRATSEELLKNGISVREPHAAKLRVRLRVLACEPSEHCEDVSEVYGPVMFLREAHGCSLKGYSFYVGPQPHGWRGELQQHQDTAVEAQCRR